METQIFVFILTFLFVFLIYEIFLVRKCKKDKKRKKPIEVQYLINRYHLSLQHLNYKQLLNVVSIVSAFDIALVVTAISILKNFYLQLAVGFVLIFALILVSYAIVGHIYQQKGRKKNV